MRNLYFLAWRARASTPNPRTPARAWHLTGLPPIRTHPCDRASLLRWKSGKDFVGGSNVSECRRLKFGRPSSRALEVSVAYPLSRRSHESNGEPSKHWKYYTQAELLGRQVLALASDKVCHIRGGRGPKEGLPKPGHAVSKSNKLIIISVVGGLCRYCYPPPSPLASQLLL
jgi:hypothetical protein